MGFNFRKSINLGGGVKLNAGKRGVGVSAGVKGARVSVNRKGVRATTSIPGTGISYSKQLGSKSIKKPSSQNEPEAMFKGLTSEQLARRRSINKVTYTIFFAVLAVIVLICVIGSLAN